MAKYIDLEKLHAELDRRLNLSDDQDAYIREIWQVLEKVPIVDVGEKPKPHWIRMCDKPVHHEIICKCSECGYGEWKPPEWWKIIANYCPNCGADMREES